MEPAVKGKAIARCPWSETDPLLTVYHDEEWGVPVHDDRKHFEFLVLEVNQAGLSWKTVLNKRERYREVYDGFDPAAAARYGDEKIALLLNDAGIIRNRKKIEASIENARRFLEVQKESGSFDAFLWGFVGGRPVVNSWRDQSDIPARTELSDKVSSELKARGFKFAGSTIVYAHLQAVGVVNDHIVGCFRYSQLTGL